MQESRYVTEIKNFFYQSLNIDKAVSPYQVWNKVKRHIVCLQGLPTDQVWNRRLFSRVKVVAHG